MAIDVEDRIAKLDLEQRRKVEERATELISEEMTLRELRKARRLTQARVAAELGITQDGVSRLEQRSDLLLSTLRKTVEAMGGSLSLVARFPGSGAYRTIGDCRSGVNNAAGIPSGVRVVDNWRWGCGRLKAPTKLQTTIRLDADLVVHFRAGGRNSPLNDAAIR